MLAAEAELAALEGTAALEAEVGGVEDDENGEDDVGVLDLKDGDVVAAGLEADTEGIGCAGAEVLVVDVAEDRAGQGRVQLGPTTAAVAELPLDCFLV